MHPEVKSDKPGKCPKCGMALTKSDGFHIRNIQERYGLTTLKVCNNAHIR